MLLHTNGAMECTAHLGLLCLGCVWWYYCLWRVQRERTMCSPPPSLVRRGRRRGVRHGPGSHGCFRRCCWCYGRRRTSCSPPAVDWTEDHHTRGLVHTVRTRPVRFFLSFFYSSLTQTHCEGKQRSCLVGELMFCFSYSGRDDNVFRYFLKHIYAS